MAIYATSHIYIAMAMFFIVAAIMIACEKLGFMIALAKLAAMIVYEIH